jgi:hypothetical protein
MGKKKKKNVCPTLCPSPISMLVTDKLKVYPGTISAW